MHQAQLFIEVAPESRLVARFERLYFPASAGGSEGYIPSDVTDRKGGPLFDCRNGVLDPPHQIVGKCSQMLKNAPLEVFYSYAHEDETLLDELVKHLKLLQRQGLISSWHDRRIEPGHDWADDIDLHSRSADIILLLVSADFISSEYCYGVEMKEALERHRRHEVIVIPIILRPVDWESAPFARIQALPRDGKAITTWPNRDEAFADVSRGIRNVVLRYASAGPSNATTVIRGPSDSPFSRLAPKDRVLDAAIPSHVVKDQSTELLAKIRLPGSPGLAGTLSGDEEAEAKPEDVRSAAFDVVFPIEPDGRLGDLRVEITLTSPDFRPDRDTKVIFVPPDADSETCYFLLTPTRIGQLRVLIELRWEEALRGSRRLRTECVATAGNLPTSSGMTLVQMKLGAGLGDENRPIDASTSAPRPEAPTATAADIAFMRRKELAEAERAREAKETGFNWESQATPEERASASVPTPAAATTYEGKSPTGRTRWIVPIIVAVITAISSITVGYWQWHPKSDPSAQNSASSPHPSQPAPVAPVSDQATLDYRVIGEPVKLDFIPRNTKAARHPGCACGSGDITFPGENRGRAGEPFHFQYDSSDICRGQGFNHFNGSIRWAGSDSRSDSTAMHDYTDNQTYPAIAGTMRVVFPRPGKYAVSAELSATCVDNDCQQTCNAVGHTEVEISPAN